MKRILALAAAIAVFGFPAIAQDTTKGKSGTAPGHNAGSPGQKQTDPGTAKNFAPGQKQEQPGGAKDISPGSTQRDSPASTQRKK
jgi:hypothetical protein